MMKNDDYKKQNLKLIKDVKTAHLMVVFYLLSIGAGAVAFFYFVDEIGLIL